MFRSISWQLQFSYGILLLVALVGVGLFGFLHRKSEMLREIDESLQLRSKRINSMLVRYDIQGLASLDSESDRSGVPQLPPLPGSEEQDKSPLYYRVWQSVDGSLKPVFESPMAPEIDGVVPHPRDIAASGVTLTEGRNRQMISRAVRNYTILVGADISVQRLELKRFLIRMILCEALFLGVFVSAGYWFTRKALKPIGQISQTAQTIAAGALDQRIPLDSGSSELRGLAQVLNHSFARLEDSMIRQREFTSNASHELRTPIAAILAEGQSKPDTLDDYKKSLARCVDTARSMKHLVDQLLELTRFDSGSNELAREVTDLDLLVDRAIQMIRPIAAEKSIEIYADIDLVQANVNSVRLSQVVVNLLSNAVAYTDVGGVIKVRLGEREGCVELAVEDNGVGISAEDLPNIFNRFYQADASRSEHNSQSFGLGLAISEEIARAHGGGLRVESEPGKGSVFTLEIPV